MEELKNQMADKIREVQIKYIYYVIALNVAAVAFAVNTVKEEKFNCAHYILAAAIFFWGVGVVLGFRYLSKFKQVLHIHYNIYSSAQTNLLLKFGMNIIESRSSGIQNKAERTYKFTLYFFYAGCLVFIAWQAIQMIYFNQANK